MALGRSISQAEINNTAAAVASSLFSTMDDIAKVKSVLDGYSSAQLVSLFGYTASEADILKSAFTDMDKLRLIFIGSATQPGASDFRFFAKQLLGTGLY